MKTEENTFVRVGYAQACSGNELFINTMTDEMITVVIKDHELLQKLYCNHVRVTVEIVSPEDLEVIQNFRKSVE